MTKYKGGDNLGIDYYKCADEKTLSKFTMFSGKEEGANISIDRIGEGREHSFKEIKFNGIIVEINSKMPGGEMWVVSGEKINKFKFIEERRE